MKLSIVIPVYNEEKLIQSLLSKLLSAHLPYGLEKEIIIVNDGSTDRTLELLENYRDNPMIKLYSTKENNGKSSALSLGFQKAAGDILLVQDADLEYDPCHYPALVDPILTDKAQVVYGSRFKGVIEGMTLANRIANVFSNMTVNWLFRTTLTDVNTGFKIFKREVLKDIEITSRHFVFEVEITVKLLTKGYYIHEVPIVYRARGKKEGKKINWLMAIEMYWGLIKYFFSTRKNKYI